MIFVLAIFLVLSLYIELGLYLLLTINDLKSLDKETSIISRSDNGLNNTLNDTTTVSEEDLELLLTSAITQGLLILSFSITNIVSLVDVLRPNGGLAKETGIFEKVCV